MSDAMMTARGEAICEINGAMLTAAGAAMMRHGNDPSARAVLLAATAMFVESIDKNVDPGFQKRLVVMLSPAKQNTAAGDAT